MERSNLFTKDQSPETLHESSRKLQRDQVFIGNQREQLQKEPAQSRKLKTLKPVPDVDGQRWCRACGKMLPVSAFPAGKRRYLCRQHLWQLCTRPCKHRRLSDTNHRHVYRLWRRCWEDAKLSFGQKGITLLQKHIAQMLQDWKDGNQNVKSAANLDRSSEYVFKNFSDCAAVVPFDPGKVLSPANAAVVDMPGRTALLRACKNGDTERYAQALGEMVSQS